jgi:hypothetical protein
VPISEDSHDWTQGDSVPLSQFGNEDLVNHGGSIDSSAYEADRTCNVTPEQCAKLGHPTGLDDEQKKKEEPLTCPTCPERKQDPTPPENRPLILYAYFESDFARRNLEFFVDHGLHAAADFVFILNGDTDVDKKIIFKDEDEETKKKRKWARDNITIKKRDNSCFDLGSHNEILNGPRGGKGWIGVDGDIPEPNDQDKKPLKEKYSRFILMNASIRGPFVPPWSDSCWSDAYLSKVTPKVKVCRLFPISL